MATTKRHRKPTRQIVFVLGMHRSGTSALSGVLTHLGAKAPQSLMVPTKDNPKGYWESVELMKLHDRVLASAGSRWNDWSHFNPDWIETPVAESFRDSLLPLLEREFGDAPLVLVKDPRISRFFPLWRQALADSDFTASVVLPLRHPQAVADSLAVRNHFGRHRSLLLWLRHMLEAEASTRDLKRSLVSYDALLDDWQAQARRIAADLGLRWPAWSGDSEAKIDEFLSSELRHHVAPVGVTGSEAFAGWADRAYQCLLELARGEAEAPRFEELDRIRGEFDRTSAIYAAVVREHETRVEGLYAKVKSQLAEASQQVEKLTAGQQEARAALEKARKSLAERESALAVQQERGTKLASQLEDLRARGVETVAALEARVATREAERERLAAELKQARVDGRAESAAQAKRIAKHEAERARIAAELDTARNEATAAIGRLEQRVAGLEAERDRLAADLHAARQQAAKDLQAARDQAEHDLQAAQDKSVADLQAMRAERDEAVAALEARLSARNADYDVLATQFEAQAAAKDALASRCEEAAARCDELARALGEAQQARTQAEASVAERFRETGKLTEMVFKLEQTVADREAALAESSRAMREQARLQAEAEQERSRRAALDEFRAAALRTRIGMLERQLDAWRKTAVESRAALVAIRRSRPGRLLGPLLQIPDPPAEPASENELAHSVWLLRQSELFDADWYRAQYLPAEVDNPDPVVHYLREGAHAGFNPGPAFDTVEYLFRYPDVRRSAANPLVHYLEHGKSEGRSTAAPVQGDA